MSAMWTMKRGRLLAASVGVLSAWACTVADKGDYTFTDNPETGGSAGKGTGGSTTAGKGGTSGEAGVMETGGTSGLGGRGGRGGRSATGGRAGKAGQAGAAGEAGEAGAAAVGGAGGTGGTGGNAGQAGESGAGGEAGATPVNTCGDGHVDTGEQCDLGANNGVTACTYGKTSCTVCTTECQRAAGTATYCGDGKRQSSHEQCDDGNTVTEGCPVYDDTSCTACDSTCKRSVPRTCGDDAVNGDTLTSINVESLGIVSGCGGGGAGYVMPYFLNGLELPNFPQSACTCSGDSSIATLLVQDPVILAAVRPVGNVFELRTDATYPAVVGWVRLTFNFQNGAAVVVTPFDFDGEAATNGANLCSARSDYMYAPVTASSFDVPRVEQCDGSVGCDSDCVAHVVPNFTGELGPSFDGWTQCEGYLDTAAGAELPVTGWGAACKTADYNSLRLVCGASSSSYRYIDVSKNFLRDGVINYPEVGYITASADQSGTTFVVDANDVYGNTVGAVDDSASWWGTGSGCSESSAGLYINPSAGCTWEVTDCFGQNLTGDRHLWVYIQ